MGPYIKGFSFGALQTGCQQPPAAKVHRARRAQKHHPAAVYVVDAGQRRPFRALRPADEQGHVLPIAPWHHHLPVRELDSFGNAYLDQAVDIGAVYLIVHLIESRHSHIDVFLRVHIGNT